MKSILFSPHPRIGEPSKEIQKGKSHYLRPALKLPNVITNQMTSPTAAFGTARSGSTPVFLVTGAYNSVMESLAKTRSPGAIGQTPAVSFGRLKESSTPAVPFSNYPSLDFLGPPVKITQSLKCRSLNASKMMSRKDSARSSASSLGQGNVTVIGNIPQEGFSMDETHVFGTSGFPREDDPAGSLNFTADHIGVSVSVTMESPESDFSSKLNPSDKMELCRLDQDDSLVVSPKGKPIEAGATPRKVASEAAPASAVGRKNPIEEVPETMSFFSRVAESLRKSQMVTKNTQLHILKQQ